jgi:DNA-binding transcriptional LysR family regulator
MRELSLDRLRTLVTIADLGSFAAAARALHLSAPTVSLHIAELEGRIGAPLLIRKRAQVVSSGVGAHLIERARRLLADADETLDSVSRQVEGREGRVRLGASTGAIAHLLPQALELLAAESPAIDVRIQVLTSADTLARLVLGTLDIGLVALPQTRSAGIRITPWRRDPILAFVPATWSPPKQLSPQWLAARPLIVNDSTTRLSRQTAEWFASAGLRPQARIELNFNDAIKSLVAAGYGAALLPHELSAGVPDPRIAMRALKPKLWRPLGVAHRANTPEAATAQVLAVLAHFASR